MTVLDSFRLDGKVAVVTGGNRGLGRAFASALGEAGATVAIVARDDGASSTTVDELTAAGIRASAFRADVTDRASVVAVADEIAGALGPVDVLVNNAGVLSNAKAEATDDAEWRRVMAVNVDGAFYWSRAVLPAMKKRGWGRIVNVASLAAKTGGLTAGTAYAASKGAMASLTFSLARECAAHGVTVNAIAPAYVKTPMVTEQLNEAQQRQILAQIPVGRFCEPEEFAHAVCFLASPLAGFITGEVLDLNGGLQMD